MEIENMKRRAVIKSGVTASALLITGCTSEGEEDGEGGSSPDRDNSEETNGGSSGPMQFGDSYTSEEEIEYSPSNFRFETEPISYQGEVGQQVTAPSQGSKFALVDLTMVNTGDSESTAGGTFYLRSGNQQYENTQKSVFINDGYRNLIDLLPDVSKEYTLLFEVPENSQKSDFNLVFSESYSDNIVTWRIPE